MFDALLLTQDEHKHTQAQLTQVSTEQLPAGEVTVKVEYSSLNYKDGLAITGRSPVVRSWPMVPGIDFVGTVEASEDDRYQPGDAVVLTGWGVGEAHWGGMAKTARVKADWLVPLPKGISAPQSMMIGTAGLTAMLCVMALEEGGVEPGGEVLVTGASGGVGSVSVSLLAKLGYRVVAVSGRDENTTLLQALGAERVVARSALLEDKLRPLDKQLWAGAIDTVGSQLLAKVLTHIQYSGTVAACGLAGGFDLPSTVMPFILRNIRLQGVDSVMCPFERRQQAWQRLAELLPESFYQQACETISLNQVTEYAERIVKGQVTGRVLVKV